MTRIVRSWWAMAAAMLLAAALSGSSPAIRRCSAAAAAAATDHRAADHRAADHRAADHRADHHHHHYHHRSSSSSTDDHRIDHQSSSSDDHRIDHQSSSSIAADHRIDLQSSSGGGGGASSAPDQSSIIGLKNAFPGLYILGDSLVDVGNNNYISTIATAQALPFGIDFPSGPTGRFSNGKILIDFLAERIGLPYPPPYLAPTTKGPVILKGVNFASAAGGILRSTGYNFIGRVDLDTQLTWVANKVQEIQSLLGAEAAAEHLAKSLFQVTIGANDYVNNYFLTGSPTRLKYRPAQYQELLLDKFSAQLAELYKLGARNILVSDVGAIGCIPSQLAVKSINGECVDSDNELAQSYNAGLKEMLAQLNFQFGDAKFIFVNTYDPTYEYSNNPTKYGFKVGNRACCGGGRFNGRLLCLHLIAEVCPDRADYVFWDAFHPTEAASKQLFEGLSQQVQKSIPT